MIALTLTIALAAQPVPNSRARNPTSAQPSNQLANPPAPPPPPLFPPAIETDLDRIAKALETVRVDPNAAAEEQRANENLQAQQDMVTWGRRIFYVGAFGAFTTLFGVILIGFTLAAARRAAAAAEDPVTEIRSNARRELRAYVHLSLIRRRTESPTDFHYAVHLKNFGKTPAYKMNVRMVAEFHPFSLVPNNPPSFRTAAESIPLGPDATFEATFEAKPENADLDNTYSKKKALVVWGEITYEDAFSTAGQRRRTAFKMFSMGDQFFAGQFEACADGNDAN